MRVVQSELRAGQVIGPYTLTRFDGGYWWTTCVCSNLRRIHAYNLRHKPPKNCTCNRRPGSGVSSPYGLHKYEPGECATPEYRTWAAIKHRCDNPRNKAWAYYGAIGVRVSPLWNGSDGYQQFLSYMGRRPSPQHSIDRWPNPAGNYEPGNVRWATAMQQAANKRNIKLITIRRTTKTLRQWCLTNGISYAVARKRIQRGWDPVNACTEPV